MIRPGWTFSPSPSPSPQSHRLFFPHRRGRSSSGAAALEEEQAQWGKLRREKKNEDALFKNPGPAPYMGLLPSD